MRVLVACEFSGTVRAAFTAAGHEAWSCDLLPTDAPGLHYQGDVLDLIGGWMPVQYSAQCDPEGNGWCEVADRDPADCPCPGPTDDRMEYLETDAGLFARPISAPHWDLMIAHPPCTYFTVSAAWAFNDPDYVKYPGIGYHQKVKPETLTGQRRRDARNDAMAFFMELMNAPIKRVCIENPIGSLSKLVRPPDQIIQPWQFGHDASKSTCLWLRGLPLLKPTDELPGGKAARRANQTGSGQNNLTPSRDRWKLRSLTYPGIAAAMAAQWGAA